MASLRRTLHIITLLTLIVFLNAAHGTLRYPALFSRDKDSMPMENLRQYSSDSTSGDRDSGRSNVYDGSKGLPGALPERGMPKGDTIVPTQPKRNGYGMDFDLDYSRIPLFQQQEYDNTGLSPEQRLRVVYLM